MNALSAALNEIKDSIETVKAPVQPKPVKRPVRQKAPKQFINGHEVKWAVLTGDKKATPYLQEETFMVQYPSKNEEINLPEGTVRASYNKEKGCVEFFGAGSDKPIRTTTNAKHEPLPMPVYMRELENVEEVFDIDIETGEIFVDLNIDVLDEATHWKLRLQEFESLQEKAGVPKKTINFRLQRYLKSLENLRGVTIEMLAQPIPMNVRDAIEYADKMRILKS